MAWLRIINRLRFRQRPSSLPGMFFCIALLPVVVSGADPATQTIVQETAANAGGNGVEPVAGTPADTDAEPAAEPVAGTPADTDAEPAAEPAAGTAVVKGVEQAAQKVMEKTVEKAADKAAEKAVQKTVEKVMEKTVEKAADKAAEKAVQKTVEKAAEKAAEKAVAKGAEQAAAKAATEAAVQAEQTARRPDEWMGPTNVRFLIFVVDIDAIDDANQSFTANVFIRLRWQDRRLANPGSAVRQMLLESVWNPRVLLANQTGQVTKSLPEVVQVDEDGTVTYYQRYTGDLSQALLLSEFPRDRHMFVIQFVAAGYSTDQLEFIPDTYAGDPSAPGGSISDKLSLPDWKVVSHEALKLTYQPVAAVHAAGFALRFEAERYLTYYIWQVVLPLGVVVMMAWSAFWVSRENVGVRIGIATSAILTMIANRFVLASLLPHLPYMTRMDYLTVGSTLLVSLSLLLVVASASLEMRQKNHLAGRVDLWGRAMFPVAFLFLLVWFLLL